MRKLVTSCAVLAAFSLAAPAVAQNGPLDELAARVDRAVQRGQVTDYHADALYRGLRNIDRTERSYFDDGHLTGRERSNLNAKIRSLRTQLRSSMRHADDQGWSDRRHRNDR